MRKICCWRSWQPGPGAGQHSWPAILPGSIQTRRSLFWLNSNSSDGSTRPAETAYSAVDGLDSESESGSDKLYYSHIPNHSHTLTHYKTNTFQTRYPTIPTSPFQPTSSCLDATLIILLIPFLSSPANPSTTFSVPFFFYLNPNTHQLPLTSSIHPHTTSTHHCPISPTTNQQPLASSALLSPALSLNPTDHSLTSSSYISSPAILVPQALCISILPSW